MDDRIPASNLIRRQKILRFEKACSQMPHRYIQGLHQLLSRMHKHDSLAILEITKQAFADLHRSSGIWQGFAQFVDCGPGRIPKRC